MLQSLPEMTINYGVVQSTPHPSLRDPCKRWASAIMHNKIRFKAKQALLALGLY
jgi:hypothetical protein